MKLLSFIKEKLLYPASLYTVIISAALMLVSLGATDTPALRGSVLAAIFGYAICLSASNLILHIKKLNGVLKVLIHFLLNCGFFFILMKIAFGVDEANKLTQIGISSKAYIVGFIIFFIVYFALSLIRFICISITKKKQQKADEYSPMF